jgi:hypothetical protein
MYVFLLRYALAAKSRPRLTTGIENVADTNKKDVGSVIIKLSMAKCYSSGNRKLEKTATILLPDVAVHRKQILLNCLDHRRMVICLMPRLRSY